MLELRLYKYDSSQEDNGYRGEDFSQHIMQGCQILEDLTEELDTAELTLCGLSLKKEFDPETKFILDLVETYVGLDNEPIIEIKDTYHWCVSRDIVSQPILSDDNYFDHHISFIEPSVIAQKRLVDNISATYKLKNVSLKEVPAYPDYELTFNFDRDRLQPSETFKAVEGSSFLKRYYEFYVGKYFSPTDIVIKNKSGETISTIYNNIEKFLNDDGTYTAVITLPKMRIFNGEYQEIYKTYEYIGDASISYSVKEYDINQVSNETTITSGDIISNSNLGATTRLTNGFTDWVDKINGEWLYESATKKTTNNYGNGYPIYNYRKYTDTNASTPNYEIEIPIKPDKKYVISVSLYKFDDEIPKYSLDGSYEYSSLYEVFKGDNPSAISSIYASYVLNNDTQQVFSKFINTFLSTPQVSGNAELVLYTTGTQSLIFSSSIPYSALSLLNKAIINSNIYRKQEGIYIADVNKSNLPFYVDDNFYNELASTQVIENFYEQKNLWEILIEIGHYIHSIPEIRFGKDDRFEITFNRLGETNIETDESTKVSIFNSKSVENYISSVSSYVSNMVQLGGEIGEWVSPKTTNEQYIISNDTAEIIVSKPIIELKSLLVKNNNTGFVRDLTQYIYEENVYKTLSIDFDTIPNRGIAMYYRLGTNKITGGQYQLPQSNTNIYTDYTFKKIIWCAFNDYSYPVFSTKPTSGYWENIKISDYSFYVQYRTKDDIRQNHSRPDIRKYLLNSKYDIFPQHNQYNNQQDILVDSVKFGNNVYGKLLKTGNSQYTKVEWVENYTQLKHIGELYDIDGQLYYVSKVKNVIYSSYILSEVVFSKDYNELSSVIGIPSEPRFYEISEQSQIKREVALNDFLLITDDDNQLVRDETAQHFIRDTKHLRELIFGTYTSFLKYGVTVFKGDIDSNTYEQTVGQRDLFKEVMTPLNAHSSNTTLTYSWDMVDNFSAGDKYIQLVPDDETDFDKRAYASLRAVPYTDIYGRAELMNFYILGDNSQLSLSPNEIHNFPESPISTINKDFNYIGTMTVSAEPTLDDVLSFLVQTKGSSAVIGDTVLVIEQTENGNKYFYYRFIRPYNGFAIKQIPYDVFISISKGKNIWNYNIFASNSPYGAAGSSNEVGLLKDCREQLSFNLNIELITSSDTFVTSPYFFTPNKKNIKLVLLDKEVNKLSNGIININDIITPYDNNGTKLEKYFNFDLIRSFAVTPNGLSYEKSFGISPEYVFNNVSNEHFINNGSRKRVKAFAVVCDVNLDENTEEQENVENDFTNSLQKIKFIFARNCPADWSKEQFLKDIYIYTANYDTLFTNKQ